MIDERPDGRIFARRHYGLLRRAACRKPSSGAPHQSGDASPQSTGRRESIRFSGNGATRHGPGTMQCSGLTWALIRHDEALRASLTVRPAPPLRPGRAPICLPEQYKTLFHAPTRRPGHRLATSELPRSGRRIDTTCCAKKLGEPPGLAARIGPGDHRQVRRPPPCMICHSRPAGMSIPAARQMLPKARPLDTTDVMERQRLGTIAGQTKSLERSPDSGLVPYQSRGPVPAR